MHPAGRQRGAAMGAYDGEQKRRLSRELGRRRMPLAQPV